MLPLLEIPILLFLIALQFSASRRVSRFWVVVRYVLTASVLIAIPLLLYFGVIIQQPNRTVSAGGTTSVTVGPLFYPQPVIRRIKNEALGAAVIIAVCGLTVSLAKYKPAGALKFLELFSWVAFGVATSWIALLVIFFSRIRF